MARILNLSHRDLKITMNNIFFKCCENVEENKRHFNSDMKLLKELNIKITIAKVKKSIKGLIY